MPQLSLERLCRLALRATQADAAAVLVRRHEVDIIAARAGAWSAADRRLEASSDQLLLQLIQDGRRTGDASIMCEPVNRGDQPIGVIAVATDEARSWREADRDILRDLAGLAGAVEAFREAGESLSESESRYRAVLDAIPVGVFVTNEAGGFVAVNGRVAEIWGGAPGADTISEYSQYQAIWPGTGRAVMPEEWPLARALRTGARVIDERIDITRFDGRPASIYNNAAPIRNARGQITGAVVAITDITAQIEAEAARVAAVEHSEKRVRAAFDAMPGSMALIDPHDGRLIEFNDTACESLGYTRVEMAALSVPDFDADADKAGTMELVRRAAASPSRLQFRRQHVTKTGERRDVLVTTRGTDDDRGRIVTCTWLDITEQVQAEAAARGLSDVLLTVLEHTPLMMVLIDEHGRMEWVSREWERILGWSLAEMQRTPDMMTRFYPEPEERRAAIEFMAETTDEWRRFTPRRPDGTPIPSSWRNVRLPDGRLLGLGRDERAQLAVEDERERATSALRASEERYALAARATASVIWEWNVATGRTNRVGTGGTVFGHRVDEADADRSWWQRQLHPDDGERAVASLQLALRDVQATEWRARYRFRRLDGEWAHVDDRAFIVRDAQGTPIRLIGAMEDVTTEQVLEERLRQSQKMEAVGQLAGGIAHDFNNLLTVMSGNLEFAINDLPTANVPPSIRADLREVQRAAERARSLTGQLLTFSRQRVATTERADLREVLTTAERMLRRVLVEEITLDVAAPSAPTTVQVDAAQLEQVLLNLVLNARDAILMARPEADSGVISIFVERAAEIPEALLTGRSADERSDAARHAWVALTVRDSGPGMDEATRSRAFEPFFTTKPYGKGTGLGLATVHGIVRRAGGHISLSSALNAGTTVTIYVPLSGDDIVADASTDRGELPLTGRTVLLVEDETTLRTVARRLLERNGVHVLEARHGRDALEVWRQRHEDIELVLTDVRMPELGGVPLVHELRRLSASLPVVFMTGYTEFDDALREFAGAVTLPKPFTGDALLAALATALGRSG